ncbi:ATP-binding protein [Nocardioides astragali]|nr:LuxR family transcriptional regulator [Nocardioides astragali]
MVGRDREISQVTEFLRGTAAFDDPMGTTMVIEGDPGVGKTALSRAVSDLERAHEATVLSGGGVQSEADIGYASLTQLLGPVVDHVDALPAAHRDSLHAALGYGELGQGLFPQVAEALAALLTDLGRRTPVVVVIDDLQWVDSASADVLGRTARSLPGSNVRFLVLQRTGVHTLFDASGYPRLRVEPLAEADAKALLTARFPQTDSQVLERVLVESAGNPLALLELPTALDLRGRSSGEQLPAHLPLTGRLQALYGGRVRQLTPATRQRLLVLALGESELPVSDATLDWLDPLLPAERAGLVELGQRPGQVSFRHPLVRSTVIDLSTAVDRRDAHLALASRYAEEDERRAWHLAAATVTPDETVATLLEAAASKALHRGDATGAIRTLVRAAELSPHPTERARRLAKAAYQGADRGLDMDGASRLLEEAALADPSGARTLAAAVATAYLLLNNAGDTTTAHRVLVAALQQLDTTSADPDMVAEAIHTLCEVCLYAARPSLWPAYHEATALVDLSAYPVLALWDQLMVDPARRAHAHLHDIDEALASLEHEGDPVRVERVATAGVFVDRIYSAHEPLMRLIRDARRGKSVGPGTLALMLLAVESFKRGEWTRTRELSDEGVQMVTDHDFGLLIWPLKLTQGWLAACTGQTAKLRDLLDQMHNYATPRQVDTVLLYAHYAAGLEALGRGEFERAFQELCGVTAPGELRSHDGWAMAVSMDLVEAAVHSGHLEEAAAHVAAMHDARLAELSSRLELLVAGSAAMAAAPFDRQLYERALQTKDADQWPFDLARIHLCYGQTLRREREAAAARPHLRTALDIFERLGARPWAERANQELQATSEAKQGAATQVGPAVLTPQEDHVASLAAQGLTNQQIGERLLISPRTVGAHLASAYRKLAVTSRGGLHIALQQARRQDENEG